MSAIRVNFDYRAAPRRFNVRALPVSFTVRRFSPVAVVKWAVYLYVAQAVAGAAVGFVLPWVY